MTEPSRGGALVVAAVVLHYRNWPGVSGCLRALAAQDRRLNRVLVMDNRSNDGSVDHIRREFQEVEVLERPSNGGYSSGMNAAIRHLTAHGARPDAVLLLTHDCYLAPDGLSHLAARMESCPRLGAAGPLLSLHESPALVYLAGGAIDPRTWDIAHPRNPGPADAGLNLADAWQERPPHEVTWLDGACTLLRTAAWEAVGPLDERFFLYYEDADYGIRLGAAGWSVECVPAARAWHSHAEASAMVSYLATRNQLLFASKHAPATVKTRLVLRHLYRAGRGLTSGDRERAKRAASSLSGLVDFGLGRTGVPRRRLSRWSRTPGPPGGGP
ncbi:MAG: glycosyltransferase family 2 protein [Candidatus Dormibacteria bacterium]